MVRAAHRDPSLTIVVWTTGGPSNSEESIASQIFSQRIAGIVSNEPITFQRPAYGRRRLSRNALVASDPIPLTGTDGPVVATRAADYAKLDALTARYPDSVSQIGGAVRVSDQSPVYARCR